MWRFACFLAGLPLGALAALVLRPEPWPRALQLGALGGGVLLLALASLAARRHRAEPERGWHLAAAASVAWIALPAALASWLGLAPGAAVWLAIVGGLLALALFGAARRAGPAGRRGSALAPPGLALLAGSVGGIGVGALLAWAGAGEPEVTERSAEFVWDVDASVPLAPLPGCEPRAASHRVLLDRGAHPRVGPDGRVLWFEADGPDGRRQVHRLDRESGDAVCWTCDEPGNNRRPAVASSGMGLVFDTDRHATPRAPANTEIHLVTTRGDVPSRPSRRLTHGPGPDDHAILAPGGFLLVWSRGFGGRYELMSATMQSGHGGLLLGTPRLLVAGGASWVAPLAWSADAHALLVARGHPLRPAAVRAIDFGTGREWSLGSDVLPAGSVGFSADGTHLVLASARRADGLGLVPDLLGFLVGPIATALGRDGRFQGGEIRIGAREDELAAVDLGALADWGVATGVGLDPDGRSFVLGQRSAAGDERLVEVQLACEGPGLVAR